MWRHQTQMEVLRPLKDFRATWERLPDISRWVLCAIRYGYTIQFQKCLPPFRGILPTIVISKETAVLRQEVSSLLRKEATEEVHPLSDGVRFLQPIFCCAQKRWRLTTNIGFTPFESCTQNEQIQDVDSKIYSVSDSTKRLVCHDRSEGCILSYSDQRKFLRFALEGKAYQYRVLPFRLALAPQTFTKWMDSVLAPLRLQGVRVPNYLDDWLVLAQSQTQARSHWDLVLNHLSSLGLRTNLQKSVLIPCQRRTFLGIDLDSRAMRARLSPPCIQSFMACLRHFKAGRTVTVSLCLKLLGLIAAASPVIRLGLLHMRPFKWWTKSQRISPRCHP